MSIESYLKSLAVTEILPQNSMIQNISASDSIASLTLNIKNCIVNIEKTTRDSNSMRLYIARNLMELGKKHHCKVNSAGVVKGEKAFYDYIQTNLNISAR